MLRRGPRLSSFSSFPVAPVTFSGIPPSPGAADFFILFPFKFYFPGARFSLFLPFSYLRGGPLVFILFSFSVLPRRYFSLRGRLEFLCLDRLPPLPLRISMSMSTHISLCISPLICPLPQCPYQSVENKSSHDHGSSYDQNRFCQLPGECVLCLLWSLCKRSVHSRLPPGRPWRSCPQ